MKKIITHYKLLITRCQKGFTIVELLLYMGLFSILLIVLVDIFVSILDVQIESEAYSTVVQDGRFMTSRLLHDLHNAQSILVPSGNGSQSATLQLVVDGVPYSYSAVGGNLQLTTNNGTDFLNGYNTTVSNIVFKRYGNINGKPTVQINFTLTGKVQRNSGQEKKDFQITGSLR